MSYLPFDAVYSDEYAYTAGSAVGTPDLNRDSFAHTTFFKRSATLWGAVSKIL